MSAKFALFYYNREAFKIKTDFSIDRGGVKARFHLLGLVREAFKGKNRKYVGLLPIGGTPAPPLARIGNFRGFFGYFLEGGGHNLEEILFTFYMFLSI